MTKQKSILWVKPSAVVVDDSDKDWNTDGKHCRDQKRLKKMLEQMSLQCAKNGFAFMDKQRMAALRYGDRLNAMTKKSTRHRKK